MKRICVDLFLLLEYLCNVFSQLCLDIFEIGQFYRHLPRYPRNSLHVLILSCSNQERPITPDKSVVSDLAP